MLSIITALQSFRYSYADEREFQDGIEKALQQSFIPYERECLLEENGVIDFLCGDVGVEVKIKGGVNEVRRQISRYAKNKRINGIIVATTRHAQLAISGNLNNKPVRSVFLGSPF